MDQVGHRSKALGQVPLFVLDDHAQRNRRSMLVSGGWSHEGEFRVVRETKETQEEE
jgi:hypothetical protein